VNNATELKPNPNSILDFNLRP